jgi:predicted DNA-binding transcriptional regulator AlpA
VARYWTTAELSAELGIPISTLYDWRARGIGPRAIRVGRWLRYPDSEVQHWLSLKRDVERDRYGSGRS